MALRWATLVPGAGELIAIFARASQRRAERLHAGMRQDLLRSDEWLGDTIAFAGEDL